MIRRFERTLAKILFPRSERWRQDRNIRTLLASVIVGLVVAGVVGFVIFQKEARWK